MCVHKPNAVFAALALVVPTTMMELLMARENTREYVSTCACVKESPCKPPAAAG